MTHASPDLTLNSRPQILVVDDEPNIRAMLTRALSLSGYRVAEAPNGPAALALLERQLYDVMVLDIQMPEMDGIEVMRRAHRLRPELLTIILTGHGSLESAIAAVRSGAVDYLLKPVGIQDIVACVTQALEARSDRLRRHHLLHVVEEAMEALHHLEGPAGPPVTTQDRYLTAGPFTLDRQKRVLQTADGSAQAAELSEGETAVLEALMAHADQVLSCHDLARLAWNYDLPEDEARSLLRQYIFKLRHKVEPNSQRPVWIHTVRGRGYLFGPLDSPAVRD